MVPNDKTEESDSDAEVKTAKQQASNNAEVLAVHKLWELTPKEQQDLLVLMEKLSNIDHWKNTPDTIVRFLRARPGDVDAAATMFETMIQWRHDNHVDTILDDYDPPTLLKEKFPGTVMDGLDKDGDPIYIGRLGATDADGFIKRFGEAEMLRHAIWVRELITRGQWISVYEQRQGRPVKRITIIEDLHGLSLMPSRAMLSLYGKVMRLDQDNYCETAKRLVILRAPFVFRAVWGIVKHFFDPGVVDKMVFTSASDYQTVLDKYMDREVLPSCICAEGKGKLAVGMYSNLEGGKITLDE